MINYGRRIEIERTRSGYLRGTTDHQYAWWIKDRNKYRKLDPLPKKLHKEIFKRIMEKVWEHMVKDIWIFKMPYNFGSMSVCESIGKGRFIDDKRSKKRGKLLFKHNIHTNKRKYYIRWGKMYARSANKALYTYYPIRGSGKNYVGMRGVSGHIKRNCEDYTKPNYRANIPFS